MSKLSKWSVVSFIAVPILFYLYGVISSLNVVDNLSLNQDDMTLDIQHRFYQDIGNTLTLNDVVALLDKFEHTPLNKAKADLGNNGFWYQIELTNTLNHPRDLAILLDNSMLDTINVYQYIGQQYVFIRSLGDSNLDNDREEIAFPNFKINLDSKEKASFLIYTSTVGIANVHISVFDTNSFYRFKDAIYLLWGSFIGIIIVMAAYNLILFTGTKEKLYVYYIGYIIGFLIELGVVHGYGAYIFPLPLFEFFSKNIISINFLLSYFSLMFALHFLKFHEQPKRKATRHVMLLSKLTLVFAGLSLLIVEYVAAQMFFTLQVFLYGVAIALIYIKVKEGIKWAGFYIFSWLPLLIGAAVGPLLLTGYIEYSFWSRHALLFSVMFEITFMAMALAQRLRISEKLRLHQASHDHLFGLANSNLLEVKVDELIAKNKKPSFSVIIVSIAKYESIVPYLPQESLKSIVFQLLTDVEQEINNELLLLDIDKNTQHLKTAMIREGVFAFLVSSNEEHLLKNVMNKFAKKQPVSYSFNDLSLNIKCLIGASTYSNSIKNTNELVNKAQQAIEVSLESGDLSGVYNDHVNNTEQRKMMLASDLQIAIEQGNLELFHQPQIDINTNTVTASEVLLRWEHPEYGFIPPDEFVRIAEDTGIINKLSEWVFNQGCIHLNKLKELGINDHRISVNMSVHDVMHNDFISYLIRTMEFHNLKSNMFILELTETVSVTDAKKFARNMLELKEIGFSLAIDDFGTGYSSLTYVSKHPFDKLKIDREFIQYLDQSEKDLTIVSATIKMAKSLGLQVVAEGVEDKKTLNVLASLNCEWAQGYHISKPLPFNQYVEWLKEEVNN